VLLLSILPVLIIGGFEIPVLYLLIPFGTMYLLYILLGIYRIPKFTKVLLLFFLLILIEIVISTLHGTTTKLGNFSIPTDTIQYISRFIVMISFLVIFYQGKVKADTFLKYFLIVTNIAMLIGFLQWIPWPGRELVVRLYPFYNIEYQLNQLNNTMSVIRVHGIAQFATANVGLAAFFFIFGLSVF